jgi:hypothetical protein
MRFYKIVVKMVKSEKRQLISIDCYLTTKITKKRQHNWPFLLRVLRALRGDKCAT